MSATQPPHRSVLLIGHSLYLLAVEAGLRAELGLTVRRYDGWLPAQDASSLDALIVDSLIAHKELVATLVAAHPEIVVIELAPTSRERGQALVRYGERRTVASAHDLARLIVNSGRNR